MALPSGVTRLPLRSITYTTQPSFPLVGRLNNTAASDIANPGNDYRGSNAQARRQTAQLDSVLDSGGLMVKTLGETCRAWIQLTATIVLGSAQCSLRPNCVYYSTSASNFDMTITVTGAVKPGDRITVLNVGTGQIDFILDSIAGVYTGGAFATKLRLKSGGGAKLGSSFTLEYGYFNAVTPTMGWFIVASNGVVGTLGDGNPIGVS